MNLLQMSFSGGILILVIVLIRTIAGSRLPKRAFLALWAVALLRLLLPFSLPSAFSFYSLVGQNVSLAGWEDEKLNLEPVPNTVQSSDAVPLPSDAQLSDAVSLPNDVQSLDAVSLPSGAQSASTASLPNDVQSSDAAFLPNGTLPSGTVGASNAKPVLGVIISALKGAKIRNAALPWLIIYLAGLLFCTGFLTLSYLKCLGKFRMSLPVREGYGAAWLKEHPLKRTVSIRQSDMVTAPLTYGLFHPVILMPGSVDWNEKEELQYILMHEYVHIRRFDAVTKLAAAAALCLHWFNPMVFIMYILFNRDIELSCDERVVRTFGEESKANYANTLIHMEEKKSGLVPFYSGFSKNAIEERIKAIMKIKKTSFGAIIFTIILITGVAALFATSAKSAPYKDSLKEALTRIPGEEFTKEESKKLFSLWIDDYEEMSVADYRDKMNKIMDEPGMSELVERFADSDLIYEINDDKEAKALEAFNDYFFYIFRPLTAEKGEAREFGGSVSKGIEGVPADPAVFEYSFSLHITDAENLKVGEYDDTRKRTDAALRNILNDCTTEELCDVQLMRAFLDRKTSLLTVDLSTEDLQVKVMDYDFSPLPSEMLEDMALHNESNEQSEKLWDETLSPYIPFGLEWAYTPDYEGGEVKMTWQGKEVRGIFDEKEKVWITEHTGNSTYSSDAIELHAVYENGKLTGLRPASDEEEEEWNLVRERNASGYQPAADAEYRSLLALKTPGYEKLSVAEFDSVLLDWANENNESLERILTDSGLDDYRADLSEEEKNFIALTVMLSNEENCRMVESLNTEQAEKICCYGNFHEDKDIEGAWCSLWYQLNYRIPDKERLTVEERDLCIENIQKEIKELWAKTDIEQLMLMSEEDIVKELNDIAASYSNERITVIITDNDIQFEKKDERAYLN